MKKIFFLILACIWSLYSWKKETNHFPPEPQIYYQSTTPNHINVFDTAAYVRILFRFTDGDGDIGNDSQEADSSIFIKDSRDTASLEYTYTYPFPYLNPSIRPKGGLEGSVTLNLNAAYFSPRDSLHLALGADTMVWSIYFKDKAGHKSNVIRSDTVYIKY